MNRSEQKKVIKNVMHLRRSIQKDVTIIADKLYECGVFDLETKLEILNASPSVTSNKHVQCGILINRLLRSEKDAYECFKMVLEDLGHHKVIQMMDKTTLRDSTSTKTSWIEDKERTFVLPALVLNSERCLDVKVSKKNVKRDTCTKDTEDEIQQLNKMRTFVLTKADTNIINYHTGKFNDRLKDTKILEECCQ